MNLKETDSPTSVILSGVLIIGSVIVLIIWALQSAYALG